MNGASDLLISLLGENGRHARSAVGVAELPMNISVEVEMIVQVA
jgi:enamine deaminase RidA (YjgF/YER057c/UK114 family)